MIEAAFVENSTICAEAVENCAAQTGYFHFLICSGNGHCAQSELSCMQKSSKIWSNPCWCATVRRNCFRCESLPKRRVAAVSSLRLDNCAGSFAYSVQTSIRHVTDSPWRTSSESQNGKSTFARISAIRDSPMSAIGLGDAAAVSV